MKKILIGIIVLVVTVSLINAKVDENSPGETFNLGLRYMKGKGVKKDMKMAHKLFLRSANMGYARAQYNMGILYHKGISVKQDNQKAFQWFEMAARQNLPEALYVMGWLYEEGKGTKKDIKKAIDYYVSASDLGEKRAVKRIEKEPFLKKDLELQMKGSDAARKSNYKSAIGYFQKSLAIREKVLGKGSINNVKIYINLADNYKKIEDYSKALKYHQKSLQIREKVLGKEHLDTATSYHNTGVAYQSMGDYPRMLEYLQKALAIREKVLGKEHPNTASSYNNIGTVYYSMGEYPKALEYYQKALVINEKMLGKEHADTASSYVNIGSVYNSMGEYPKALEYIQKSLVIREKVLGKEHPDTALSYHEIGVTYGSMGDYPKALEYNKKSLAIKEKVLGEEHPDTASSYNNIGTVYYSMGDYSKALEYYPKALAIREKILGREHADTASSYDNIGSVYNSMGDYSKALEYYQKALFIKEKVLGREHPNVATVYNNIGFIYKTMGEYPKALAYHQKSLVINEKVLGKEHPVTATSYHNIGSVYYSMGEYPKALEYHKKTLAIREKVLGKEHADTANSIRAIGNFYRSMGDYPKALEYYQKTLVINEKVLGIEHVSTATSYDDIGTVYYSMGDYSKALEYIQKSLVIREKVLGKEHADTASGYNNISKVYESRRDYSKALEYYQKALSIFKKALGREHPNVATVYNNIGYVYGLRGDYSKVLEYYQKALAIREKVLGKEHADTASSYRNISFIYHDKVDYHSAYHYAQKAFQTFIKNRDSVFTILDSKEKEKYLNANTTYVALFLSSTYHYIKELNKKGEKKKAKTILQSGAKAWLNYKGSVFDSENAIAMLYVSTKDIKLKVKIDELISSKRYLAQLYQSLSKPKEREAWQNNIKTTEEKIGKLTNEIASKATSFKEQQGLQSISYRDIASQLGKNELYIDYAKVGYAYYFFTIDHQEKIEFVQIDKKSTKIIDTLVKAFREDITAIIDESNITDEKLKTLTQSSKEKLSQLYELIIQKPLGNTIKDKMSLIISPDGALRLLPFEALYDKANKQYIIEEKEIRYIPSGKELVRLYRYSKDKVAKSTSVIFANPNFNTKIASLNKEQIAITPNTNRSGIIKSLFRMRFDPLPGTEEEAKAIKDTLKKSTILEYQTNKATESTLMKVKEPKILHIATHGFFINDNSIPNPMLKSGIALAGANASAIKGKSDGIVTALKLSGLDLKGTDLVVLSACQTGVVDINATDSVSGLSKAFIQAGAKDIVMSLWSVDDQATKELMTSFYQEMKQNKNYARALKAAKLKIIEEGRHPFYWAAFVVSGL